MRLAAVAGAFGLALGAASPASAQGSAPPGGGRAPSGTVSVTPEYRFLFGIPIIGGEVSGAFGFDDGLRKRLQAEVALSGFFGQTRAGLPVVRGSIGALLDLRHGGFHFGGVLGAGLVGVRRAQGGDFMTSLTLPTNLFVGPELVVDQGFVLALDATLAVDWIVGSDTTPMWGPGLGLRARVF